MGCASSFTSSSNGSLNNTKLITQTHSDGNSCVGILHQQNDQTQSDMSSISCDKFTTLSRTANCNTKDVKTYHKLTSICDTAKGASTKIISVLNGGIIVSCNNSEELNSVHWPSSPLETVDKFEYDDEIIQYVSDASWINKEKLIGLKSMKNSNGRYYNNHSISDERNTLVSSDNSTQKQTKVFARVLDSEIDIPLFRSSVPVSLLAEDTNTENLPLDTTINENKLTRKDSLIQNNNEEHSSEDLSIGTETLSKSISSRDTMITNKKAQISFRWHNAISASVAGYKVVRSLTIKILMGHSCRVKCIAISPGENELVSCSNEEDQVELYSFRDGREVCNFIGHSNIILSCTFSPDGKFLATTSRDCTMKIWDVLTCKPIYTIEHPEVVICCCFSRDAKLVVTGCQDKICRLWDFHSRKAIVTFAEHEGIIICMSYSPDNSHIVSGSGDKTLRIWSTAQGLVKHVLRKHSGVVLSCAYTNDGRFIVSNDQMVLLVWDPETGVCVKDIHVDSIALRYPSLSNDSISYVNSTSSSKKTTWTFSSVCPGLFNRFVIIASNNRFVYIIDIETGEEVASHLCKSPVFSLCTGYTKMMAFGDTFGNVYVCTIR